MSSTGATGTTGGTGVSGTQQAAAQASGSPISSSAAQQQANTGGVTSTYPGTTGAAPPKTSTGTTVKFEWPTVSLPELGGAYSLFLFVYMLFFHVGAGVLSYRKYGSMGWAVIAGIFAYVYYPYYAFTATSPAEAAPAPLIGGMLKAAFKNGKSRRR